MSEKSRIRWRCRRGMKELDVLLERFLAAEYDALSSQEHAEFEALLENEDPVLYALLFGTMPAVTDAQQRLIAKILASRAQ